MKALHIARYGRFPEIISRQIPILITSSQVLVKMAYAPINPSDINFYQGLYGIRKQGFPIVGFEGSGTIIKSVQSSLVGKKVSILANSKNGTFSTHMICNTSDLIFWPENSNLQQISMSMINPLSCIGFCEQVKNANPKSVLLSAAGSNLCKMTIKKLSLEHKRLKIIGMTRNSKYNKDLMNFGCQKVLSIPLNEQEILFIQSLQKTVFLDCVGGQFAGKTFNYLGQNSTMINYGRLSKQNLGSIDIGGLYFKNKLIKGFWLNTFLNSIDQQHYQAIKKEVVNNFNQIYRQTIRKIYPLNDFLIAFKQSIKNQSEGKILLNLNE